MSFYKVDKDGKQIRNRVAIDFSDTEVLTEQNHKGAVDINKIVATHGIDRIAETQQVMALSFDTDPYNNFQEMMEMVAKGREAFMSLPAETRDEFRNDPARYMDYVQNPDNRDALIERGWIEKPEEIPVAQVQMMVQGEDGNLVPALAPETPPGTTPAQIDVSWCW